MSDENNRRAARERCYAPGEYVEQESFMLASEIRALAERAGIARGVSVLDLCCGVAGPGRFITRELGCDYVGVDASSAAIQVARERAAGLPCRFVVGRIPPLPEGRFEVVLLLETILAFRDKAPLLQGVAAALEPHGRFAFTLEEGQPLTGAERQRMPAADTVWLTPLAEMYELLADAGLEVVWHEDLSASHLATAARLAEAVPPQLAAAHRLWAEWLQTGRVRKFAFVVHKRRA